MIVIPLGAHADEGVDVSSRGPVVSLAEGDVQVKISGSSTWEPAEEGLILGPGDMVRTGSGSRIEITHYSGTTRLYENTILTVPSIFSRNGNRDINEVLLEDGAGLFRLDSERLKGGFKVRTRHVVAGVKGTTFAVKTDEQSSKVAVYEGRVEVREIERVDDGDAGRSDGDRMELVKGKSIEAVIGKGLGQVEKFKQRDDWNGWKKGQEPQIDGKTSGKKKEETVKGNSVSKMKTNGGSERDDYRGSSDQKDVKDVNSEGNMNSNRNANSISGGPDKPDDNPRTTVDSNRISK